MVGILLLNAIAIDRFEPIIAARSVVTSPFPPSFDNNPVIFWWALFSRLLIATMSLATLVRLVSKTRSEHLAVNHPMFVLRASNGCFLIAAFLGSSSDVLTYLFWGEVSSSTTGIVLLIARLFDAVTFIPFLGAVFTQVWIAWLIKFEVAKPKFIFSQSVGDMRSLWQSPATPLMLLATTAASSFGVTMGKYWLWSQHVVA